MYVLIAWIVIGTGKVWVALDLPDGMGMRMRDKFPAIFSSIRLDSCHGNFVLLGGLEVR